MKKVFFVGAPASGKTTTARDFALEHGMHHLSSGDVARAIAKTDDKIRQALERGEYIPPEKMDRLMMSLINENRNIAVVIDGYPRYFEQLADILANFPSWSCSFVVVECPIGELARRHDERGRYTTGSFDDRIHRYMEQTHPMVKWLKKYKRSVSVSTFGYSRSEVIQRVNSSIMLMDAINVEAI